MTAFEECEGPENSLLFVVELLQSQMDIEGAGVQECVAVVMFSTEVQRTEELGTCLSYHQRGLYRRRRCIWYGWRGRLATSCVNCCSCAVKTTNMVLMLFLEMFCLSISSWRWCYRYPKASATSWGVSGGNNIWRAEFLRGLGITGKGNLLGGCPLE